MPGINVSFVGSTAENSDPTNGMYIYTYRIDILTSAFADNDNAADSIAMFQLQDMMGKVQSILMNPIYATLGYPRSSNIVKNRKVINSFITYYENDKVMNGDGLGSRFGRVLIEGRVS